MSYTITFSGRFKKQYAKCLKRGYKEADFERVLRILTENGSLPQEFKPHRLSNTGYDNCWECHIKPDWLLIWQQNDDEMTLLALATGSHSDLY